LGCEGFLPEFPQLARKIFGPLFVHEDHILDDLKKSVILGAISSNQSTLGAIFFKSKHTGCHFFSNQSSLGAIFAFIFREFAQIFRDFAKVFTDFH